MKSKTKSPIKDKPLRYVAQSGDEALDDLLHDIVGDSFNVDHVAISNKGIYVIETKTYSKPASGQATINYDGQKILVNGKTTYKDIPIQVKAATSYIKKI